MQFSSPVNQIEDFIKTYVLPKGVSAILQLELILPTFHGFSPQRCTSDVSIDLYPLPHTTV